MAKSMGLTWAYLILTICWAWSAVAPVLIPYQINVVITATCIVYIGCHRSLPLLLSEAEGGVTAAEKEVLSTTDAYKFPLIGSAVLFTLYMVLKHFKEYADIIIAIYFSLAGVMTMTWLFSEFASQFYNADAAKKYGIKKTVVPLLGDVEILLNSVEFVCLGLAGVVAYYYVQTKHYLLSNLLGISFCVQSIEKLSIGSFKVGAILLCGLFFYDIFWVFGSEVMISVAKGFDGPVKILFMRAMPSEEDPKGKFSLLGLGDIVIPALFIALLLRFDAVRNKVPLLKGLEHVHFAKPYFHVNIVCYMLGLIATLSAMHIYNAGQPALLYLVPACLGGAITVGFLRQEFGALFAYNEEPTEEQKAALEASASAKAAGGGDNKKDQ